MFERLPSYRMYLLLVDSIEWITGELDNTYSLSSSRQSEMMSSSRGIKKFDML